ncbi:hypothetical protein FISHEDRAFT_67031 [Fistulina hepatica ATCC 64428]|uniref:Uncharacterized protein n=1 Tax=Fistulina hepatica ATCC 64428 TaxID=1128425 RepID=A0A0D7A428_9AGAR|nr:hypothetical protein FISHEDRAFT_67031 [Fistulina hepatica ATCC 64428]
MTLSLSTVGSTASNTLTGTRVVTSPPWAKDEPPSPKEEPPELEVCQSESSEYGSYHRASTSAARWWPFTLTRPLHQGGASFREWISPTVVAAGLPTHRDGEKESTRDDVNDSPSRGGGLSLEIPKPAAPFTLAQVTTPGWDTPWTARPRDPTNNASTDDDAESHTTVLGPVRKQRWRRFLLTNVYVPLLFRFINLAFTTGALGLAVRIRAIEQRNNVMGIIGPSPTIIIIFAPLTLVHVVVAVYFEYFGRPLGLWRTSAKLAYTLLEVVFICLWSSSLSLCFDNWFTTTIPCTSVSSTRWYSELPPPNNTIPSFEGSDGDRICDDQLALALLVFVGVLMYIINLVISLFRIFEKMKGRQR